MTALLELLPPPVIDRAPIPEYDVRVLTVEEAAKLTPVFHAHGVEPPDPAFGFIVGAITPEGQVTDNFLVAQLMVHAEPLHLEAGCEHLFRRMAHTVVKELQQRIGTCVLYVFTPSAKIESMAQAMGMTREPWGVVSMQITGPPPKEDSKLEVAMEPQLNLDLEEEG